MEAYPKSILFRVDANATIGWGHFYRSLALAQMLAEEFDIVFAVSEPLPQIQQILRKHGFELITLPALDYTAPDARGNNEFECDLHGYLDSVDIVVTDGYWFQEKYRNGLRKENIKIAVIEDDGGGEYDADLVINHAPGLSQLNYKTLPKTRFALGIDFALLRPEFIQAAKSSQNSRSNTNKVFICFGGADLNGLAITAAQQVLKYTKNQVNLVIPPKYKWIEEITKLKHRYSKRIIIKSNLTAEEVVDVIAVADYGIVPSSSLLYECIACKLPVISGYFTDNQKQIYTGFKNRDAFVDTGNFNPQSWQSILTEIVNFAPKHLIDGRSVDRYRKVFRLINK